MWSRRFMWVKMYTHNCDVRVFLRKRVYKGAGPAVAVCLSLVCVPGSDPLHWQTAQAGGRPCAAAMRDIWFCELGFAPCLSQISVCVRQRCAPPLVNMWVFPFRAPEVCVLVFPYCSWHLQSLWNAAILWCHCSGSCKPGKWLAFSRSNIQYIESFQSRISNR